MSRTDEIDTDALVAFIRARLDEDERLARQACEHANDGWRLGDHGEVVLCWPPEPHVAENERRLGVPVTADEWRGIDVPGHMAPHVARHDPAHVLRDVEAKRKLLDQYERLLRSKEAHAAAAEELSADLERQEQTGTWDGPGFPDVRLKALRREDDYLAAMLPVLGELVKAAATVHSDHEGYQESWRP
ncbi:hypothetical protein Sme01_03420 [Sphaerisporangium melleum]|uniref:Uncharacterized protein n=1 Tax=Sphaerisporangium melleum TaxID=321316 RepID=A0A917VCM7_9ACTN|nr:DUF6221 family protein [Sphaerisporangium melleum]GGK61654.1 hypothetical protein GCM10007964_00970 [Sphaerisporangium melleum]GII67866.1 hypothetical protein Sme01_03420 [Sphaerisporangium melleum]